MFEILSDPNAWGALVTLTFLEIVLGIDNIIFISIASSKLPENQQKKATNIGLFLAMVLRIILLFGISYLTALNAPFWHINLPWLQVGISGQAVILFAGGLFLIYKSTKEIHEKVPDIDKMKWDTDDHATWSEDGAAVTWHEAWECARPWVKDPRVHQPQRLYHPDGWASGELDLVLRWDGRIRLVDIKSGRSGSAFSSSLEHQLRFYSWLWNQTHDGELVASMEGWYLNGGERVMYDAPDSQEIEDLTEFYRTQHELMQAEGEAVLAFPRTPQQACDGSAAGCVWCSVSNDDSGWNTTQTTAWIESIPSVSLRVPYQPLASIQGRVSVRGSLGGEWSLANHFGEQVLGAVLVSGQKHVTVEESEPGAFADLHKLGGEVEIHNAMPGVWRDQPRVYLDEQTTIIPASDKNEESTTEFTRLGLLRTRANVSGHVLSLRKRSGVRLDGKPWTMLTFILWDGAHVAEVVAFGSSINQRLLNLRPGDLVSMTGVEIGWRSGILQLRIDNRKTRFETSTQPSFKN